MPACQIPDSVFLATPGTPSSGIVTGIFSLFPSGGQDITLFINGTRNTKRREPFYSKKAADSLSRLFYYPKNPSGNFRGF
jgi:hypothetical protein